MADYLKELDLLNKAKKLNPAGAINNYNNGGIVFPGGGCFIDFL